MRDLTTPLLPLVLASLVGVPACANRTTAPAGQIFGSDGGAPDEPPGGDTTPPGGDASSPDGSVALACATRISYGRSWIHPAQHPDATDLADGRVSWDGACTDDGANSYALLSNGWKPYFA